MDKHRIEELSNNYLTACKRSWGILSTSGMAIQLDDVFVMPRAIRRPAYPSNQYGAPTGFVENQTNIRPVSSKTKSNHVEPPELLPLGKALAEAGHIVILGGPGSGKSTSLQFLGLCFANNDSKERLDLNEVRIPVRISLNQSNYAEAFATPGQGIEKSLSREVSDYLPISAEEAFELVCTWRDTGQLLILLDGLDEVPDKLRSDLRTAIINFCSYRGQNCRVLISSRMTGYIVLGGGFKEFELVSFDKDEEISLYLQYWLASLRPEWKDSTQKRVVDILEELRQQSSLRQMKDNPLFLRLIAEVYSFSEEITHSRMELYEKWIERLWQIAQDRGGLSEQKETIMQSLEAIAWILLMPRQHRQIALRDLQKRNELVSATWDDKREIVLPEKDLVFLGEKLGLLSQVGGRIRFTYQSIHEYFIARRLRKFWKTNNHNIRLFLRPRLHLSEWQEPISLLSNTLSKESYQLIHLIQSARSPNERLLDRDVLLAIRLCNESQEPHSTEQLTLLRRALRSKQWLVRRYAVYVLRRFGDSALPLLSKAIRDSDRDVRVVVAWALGEINNSDAITILSKALDDNDWYVRKTAVHSLEKYHNPQTIPFIKKAIEDSDFEVQLASVLALQGVDLSEAIRAFLVVLRHSYRHYDYLESQQREQILELLRNPSAFSTLLQALGHDDLQIQASAAWALGLAGNPEAIDPLSGALKSDNDGLRIEAARALGEIRDSKALPVLVENISDEYWKVRWGIADALGLIRDPQAIPAILQLCIDPYEQVRFAAVKALAAVTNSQDIYRFTQAIDHEQWVIRQTTAWILGALRNPQAVPYLAKALGDTNSEVRKAAVLALASIADSEACDILEGALENPDLQVRQFALQALGNIGDHTATASIAFQLDHDNEEIALEAAKALGKLGVPALPALHQAIRYKNPRVRKTVIEALGSIGNQQSVPALVHALDDEDEKVREEAAGALGKVGGTQAVQALVNALKKDVDNDVRFAAIRSLDVIGDPLAIDAAIQALVDKDARIREWAARALGDCLANFELPTDETERKTLKKKLRRAFKKTPPYHYQTLIAIATILQSIDLAYLSLWAPVESSKLKKYGLKAFNWFLRTLLIGLGGVVAVVISASQDTLGEQIKPWLQALTIGRLVLIVFSLSILAGLISLSTDWLKSQND